MLTGENAGVGNAVGREREFDEVRANFQMLLAEGGQVAMA